MDMDNGQGIITQINAENYLSASLAACFEVP